MARVLAEARLLALVQAHVRERVLVLARAQEQARVRVGVHRLERRTGEKDGGKA